MNNVNNRYLLIKLSSVATLNRIIPFNIIKIDIDLNILWQENEHIFNKRISLLKKNAKTQ